MELRYVITMKDAMSLATKLIMPKLCKVISVITSMLLLLCIVHREPLVSLWLSYFILILLFIVFYYTSLTFRYKKDIELRRFGIEEKIIQNDSCIEFRKDDKVTTMPYTDIKKVTNDAHYVYIEFKETSKCILPKNSILNKDDTEEFFTVLKSKL